MDIKCFFYAEFDTKTGPELICQLPEGCMDKQTFRSLASNVIPDKQLCGKLTILQLSPTQCLMGLPVAINDTYYDRGSF
jgi:hypothetical protein